MMIKNNEENGLWEFDQIKSNWVEIERVTAMSDYKLKIDIRKIWAVGGAAIAEVWDEGLKFRVRERNGKWIECLRL